MINRIPLTRRFAPPDEEVLRDPSFRSMLGEMPQGVLQWPDLLACSPVLVIGEGKCGKTFEFQKQVETLKGEGHFAFFVPLERLMNAPFNEALSIADEAEFEAWKSSGDLAFFFLDALDELKLRDGVFREAFNKVRRAVGVNFARVRFFVSCRPGDPTLQFDLEELTALAAPKVVLSPVISEATGVDAFIETIQRFDHQTSEVEDKSEEDSRAVTGAPVIVSLLPLENAAIRECARLYSAKHADGFCNVLDAQDLWHLYRLPDDIMKALDYIGRYGSFGTLEEQLRAGIEQKLAERVDRKPAVLDVNRAREGAERLALATLLMKRRSIRVDSSGTEEVLSVGDILPDFTPPEQAELVGKALFDPSGVGVVRFHHRETQEYLAAQRLSKLRNQGLSTADLMAMMFCSIAGQSVIKPTMEPVAAWLALSHADVLAQVQKRKPHLMFSAGLPGSMTVEMKASLLRSYVGRYRDCGWCMAGIGHGKLRQIADPGLGPIVRDLWEDAYAGHDTLEVLLELIWLTPLPECADLSLLAVQDTSLEIGHLTFAGRGILAAGDDAQKTVLKDMCLARTLPETVVRYLLPDLFPRVMTLDEFWNLVEGMTEVPGDVHGLGYEIYCAVKEPGGASVTLRNMLVNAIWSTRKPDSAMYEAFSDCDHYQDAVLAICAAAQPVEDDQDKWADALAIGLHFGDRQGSIIARDDIKVLNSMLSKSTVLREAYFWACIRLGDALETREDDWGRFIRATSEMRTVFPYQDEDQGWLLSALNVKETRGVAFHALKQWFDLRSDHGLLDSVRARVLEDVKLLDILDVIKNPEPRKLHEYEIRHEQRKLERAVKEQDRIAGWVAWRAKILGDPDFGMEGEGRLQVLYDVASILRQARSERNRRGGWNAALIAQIMSPAFLESLRIELLQFWREAEVLLRSERELDKRGTYYASWSLALTALKSEAETEGWAADLTPEEAEHATRIACVEFNSTPTLFADLEQAHPEIISKVIAGEAVAQLRSIAATGDAPILHNVQHHNSDLVKRYVAHSIAPELASVGIPHDNSLEYAVQSIAEHGSEDDIQIAIDAITARLGEGSMWLSLLSHLDIAAASGHLLAMTLAHQSTAEKDAAGALFVAVFGDRWSSRVAGFDRVDDSRRIPLLRDLVLRAYQVVRRDDDLPMQTRKSGGARDKAEGARSALFDRLIATQSTETVHVLQGFSVLPEFSHMADRLQEMAKEVAARVSDEATMSLPVFRSLNDTATYVPHDRSSLFQIMTARLDDFAHDLAVSETSVVDTLRKVESETELRRFIAHWLDAKSRGAYSNTQEAVAHDEKRTDIRLQPNHFAEHAAIELKLDDTRCRWSGQMLKEALFDQLIGKYLNHENCRVGCFLIVMREVRRWQNPDTGAMMHLVETVAWLQGLADAFCKQHSHFHVCVKGIDCSVK
ncbi:MAG: hypothetical protein ABJT31_17065 [Hyphomicrobiales bacterium]